MQVKLYELVRTDPLVNGNSGSGFALRSFEDDVRTFEDVSPEDVAPRLAKECRRTCAFVGYTCDTDPEYLYTLPSSYSTEGRRKHALRLWATGNVTDEPMLRAEGAE